MKKNRTYKRFGSYPYVTVIFSITFALFVLGLSGLLALQAFRLSDSIKNTIEVYVYLDKYMDTDETREIGQKMRRKDYLSVVDNRPQIRFISKDEAARKFIKETHEDFVTLLGENPLRDAYVIRIRPELYQKEMMRQIKADLESVKGVFEAVYLEQQVEEANRNIYKLTWVLLGFAIILFVAVFILINNTLRLAMYSQRFLIRSMQLVGATSSFIQKPFLLRAVFYGLFGGLLASAGLYGLLSYAASELELFTLIQEPRALYMFFGGLCTLGILVSMGSSYRALNKYLNMSLDELY
ncbi:cell division protein FtsX [Xanthocytophaga agilis]|uniref:Cell division protein FtsX n=1 Tax=Xanthocytophaga agilis TaxID=3048010 RepID=A0AAE3RDF2_9BACT|nr:permease-like cell division protein FtsX [Xanthocytophaga agilis]MDJ1506604.1 permease-like cell division protein FtsX [Xanthocytophaga agilis]